MAANTRNTTSDAEAVRAVLSGDRDAFVALVERYQEVAFRAAYLVTRDAAAAEDVAQDAFVRAFRQLRAFRVDEAFRPWLLRIVTNLALNEVRRRKRKQAAWSRLVTFRGRDEPPLEAAVVIQEEQRRLWDAISGLPENDRVVLYLRYFLELPEREIAAAIGCAPGTVKSRLHRASARLRERIEAHYPSLAEEVRR